MKLELTDQEAQNILNLLAELPIKTALNLFNKIKLQIEKQKPKKKLSSEPSSEPCTPSLVKPASKETDPPADSPPAPQA